MSKPKSETHERPVPLTSRIAGYDRSYETDITDDEGNLTTGVGHTPEDAEEDASEKYKDR